MSEDEGPIKLKFLLTTTGPVQLRCVKQGSKKEVFERKVKGPAVDYTVTAELDGAVIFNVLVSDGSALKVNETIGLTNESSFPLTVEGPGGVKTVLYNLQKVDLVFGPGIEGYNISRVEKESSLDPYAP